MKYIINLSAPIMLFSLLVVTGCSKNIEGHIIDNFGNPIKGAKVEVIGTAFKSITDEKGIYKLDYAPGKFKIIVQKDGYIQSESNELNIAQKVKYPLSPIYIIKIPKYNGLSVNTLKSDDYFKVKKVGISSRITRFEHGKKCLISYFPESSSLPKLEGNKFIAFIPPVKKRNWHLLKRVKGNVLARRKLHMFASCSPFVEEVKVKWNEKYSDIIMIEGNLETGDYCLAQLDYSSMIGATIDNDGAFCFHWEKMGEEK